MTRRFMFVVTLILLMFMATVAMTQCVTIKSGAITDASGNALKTGFDQYGYNYQAHLFNGLLDNYGRPTVPVTAGDISLVMKWSDEWISNQDCNGDKKLDRGLDLKAGNTSDGISKGWCTNHFEGDYEDAGVMYHYTEEIKMVFDDGYACRNNGSGCLWGSYNIVEDVINDSHGGFHGVQKSTLANPAGLGFYSN